MKDHEEPEKSLCDSNGFRAYRQPGHLGQLEPRHGRDDCPFKFESGISTAPEFRDFLARLLVVLVVYWNSA